MGFESVEKNQELTDQYSRAGILAIQSAFASSETIASRSKPRPFNWLDIRLDQRQALLESLWDTLPDDFRLQFLKDKNPDNAEREKMGQLEIDKFVLFGAKWALNDDYWSKFAGVIYGIIKQSKDSLWQPTTKQAWFIREISKQAGSNETAFALTEED